MDSGFNCLNSIEMIDARAVVRGDQPAWQIIKINKITPRALSLVAPLSPTEILIAGGRGIRGKLGDGYVFNLQTKSVS